MNEINDLPQRSATVIKVCNTCRLTKPTSAFGENLKLLDGLKGRCRDCSNAVSRSSYAKNPDSNLARSKKYQKAHPGALRHHKNPVPAVAKACTTCKTIKSPEAFGRNLRERDSLRKQCNECRNAENRKDYAENPAPQLARGRKWQKENPESAVARTRRWQKRHPLFRASVWRRAQQAIPKWLSWGQKCQIEVVYHTRDFLSSKFNLPYEVDHIIPLRGKDKWRGHVIEVSGLHVPCNLRILLRGPNRTKLNKFINTASKLFDLEYKTPSKAPQGGVSDGDAKLSAEG
jgi:hypothetical protein